MVGVQEVIYGYFFMQEFWVRDYVKVVLCQVFREGFVYFFGGVYWNGIFIYNYFVGSDEFVQLFGYFQDVR